MTDEKDIQPTGLDKLLTLIYLAMNLHPTPIAVGVTIYNMDDNETYSELRLNVHPTDEKDKDEFHEYMVTISQKMLINTLTSYLRNLSPYEKDIRLLDLLNQANQILKDRYAGYGNTSIVGMPGYTNKNNTN